MKSRSIQPKFNVHWAKAALLRIQPIATNTPNAADAIGQLLKFQSTQRLYLPPLPSDPPDTLANALLFDGIIQIELEKLLLATRRKVYLFNQKLDIRSSSDYNNRAIGTLRDRFRNITLDRLLE